MSIRRKKSSLDGKKRKAPTEMSMVFSEAGLREDLRFEARTVGIPDGMAESVAKKVAKIVNKWAKERAVITTDDLNKKVADEVRKYSTDLAYVYENRGTII